MLTVFVVVLHLHAVVFGCVITDCFSLFLIYNCWHMCSVFLLCTSCALTGYNRANVCHSVVLQCIMCIVSLKGD